MQTLFTNKRLWANKREMAYKANVRNTLYFCSITISMYFNEIFAYIFFQKGEFFVDLLCIRD